MPEVIIQSCLKAEKALQSRDCALSCWNEDPRRFVGTTAGRGQGAMNPQGLVG
jgi:hypothetical protein